MPEPIKLTFDQITNLGPRLDFQWRTQTSHRILELRTMKLAEGLPMSETKTNRKPTHDAIFAMRGFIQCNGKELEALSITEIQARAKSATGWDFPPTFISRAMKKYGFRFTIKRKPPEPGQEKRSLRQIVEELETRVKWLETFAPVKKS
jgi:hypothetical protein